MYIKIQLYAVFICFLFLAFKSFSQDIINLRGSISNDYLEFDKKNINSVLRLKNDTGIALKDFSTIQSKRIIFRESIMFYYNIFNCNPDFDNCLFCNEALFVGNTFKYEADFRLDTFNRKVWFIHDSINRTLNFRQSVFNSYIHFDYVYLNDIIDFERTTFNHTLSINKLFTGPLAGFNFDSSILPPIIDFSNNDHINCEINLLSANFKEQPNSSQKTTVYQNMPKHKLYLYNSNIPKLHVDYYHFEISLIEPSTKIELPRDEAKTVYEGLLKNFKDRGQNDSYELLDIEYRDYLYGKWNFIRLWNSYGYHKEWVFRWIGIFILFFTIITSFLFNKLNKKIENGGVYFVSNIPEEVKVESIRNFFRRIWYSLMYTSTIFFLLTLKIENINFRKPAILYLILVYSTGIICLGYLANFVLQK